MTLLQEAPMHLWQGRQDAEENEYFFQAVQRGNPEGAPGYSLLGFASDEGVKRNLGRAGSYAGPNALRSALARIALHKNLVIQDEGTICCDDGNLEQAQQQLGQQVYRLLEKQQVPIVLGGGHETAWGHYQGIRQHLGNQALSIINIDAHFDLRAPSKDGLGSSGTPFWQIAQDCQQKNLNFDYHVFGLQPSANTTGLYQTAQRLGVEYINAEDFLLGKQAKIEHAIEAIIQKNQPIYLSICLDAFASDIAPGVSAPQPLGLSPTHVIALLNQLKASQQLIAIDVVELAPCYDIDQRTSKLAAQLIAMLLR
jgi:formiminoglutamase